MANAKSLQTFTIVFGCTLVFFSPSKGQTYGASTSSSGSSSQTGQSSGASTRIGPTDGDPSFQGSVPDATASGTPLALSLEDAINRGLRANLGLLTSQQSDRQTLAQRFKALSGLLPKVTGEIAEIEQQINLQALGFNIAVPPTSPIQIPKIIAPYSYQEARLSATVPLFDFNAISNYRSAKQSVKASTLSIQNARDLVVQAVGNAYLQIIADAARVVATQAEVDADNAQYMNAVRRHDAGTGTGIDVLRSQVELKQRQQTLVAQRNQFEKDKLTLARVIGLAPGQDFTVSDPSPQVPLSNIVLQEVLAKAYANRPDFQAAQTQVRAAEFSLRAAKAERYPTLQASGYYAAQGLHLFGNSHGVFQVTGSIQFNVFDGGRIKGDILESNADLRNKRNQLENLRGQIDYEVRNALLDLKSSGEQVDVAHSNVDLANETLKQSRDRFAAGVTNTVEVVQAQQSVADAYENLISAQYQYNVAKVSLARSLGLAEQGIRGYFNQRP
jgi:outer membrane protein TolC